MKYDFAAIESRWQAFWDEHRTFATPNPGDAGFDPGKPKFYVLDMFPYPSGAGLHVGHPLGYIATDVIARYKRMCGCNVLHPMGYDAFGLPAEQYAVEHNVHPRVTTQQNIETMTRQLRRLGLSYDWDRCLATTDPDYTRWTQWIFLRMFHSWFDPAVGRARPIDELKQMLASERLYVSVDDELLQPLSAGLDAITGTPIGALKWHELSPEDQRRVLDLQRLAYRAEVPVNWCPALGTVLANEEVTNDGRSERGNHPVVKRPLKQWMLRITAFAERLGHDLDLVDWPESVKLMQRKWIGRSEGALVDFALDGADDLIRVFTTRPDTLFGATYMVLAPEHPLVDQITTPPQSDAVTQYREQAASRSEIERLGEAGEGEVKQKTGVFTGAYAINPVNGEKIPIWIADYVLIGYGTGAIMAVPAHDQRDFEFARQFALPIRVVVMPDPSWLEEHGTSADVYRRDATVVERAFCGEGAGANSANDKVSLDDKPTGQAKQTITAWLEQQRLGRGQVQYKLRDWLFSRQRYWGEPFPVVHGPDGEVVAIDDNLLPVELPQMADFKPQANDDIEAPPKPPLSRAPDAWRLVELPGRTGERFERELNTMPQWAGSCWYYLRFIDPKNEQRFVGRDAEAYWMGGGAGGADAPGGVDLYVGGAEHAVLHLLYARFWHKVLYDLNEVSTPEPFARLFNQGYIQAHAYTDDRGVYVPADEVDERDGRFFHRDRQVSREFGKMGKSLKNAVTPDDICEQYGCDTMRLYEMYLGPLEQSKVWNTRDILGPHRFLQRLWRNFVDDETGALRICDTEPSEELRRLLHQTIKRVTDGLDRLSINTTIAALIELNNELVALEAVPREVATTMVLLLAPMAPHICEQLWSMLGHEASLACEPWPRYDDKLLQTDQVRYPVQVNGKLRSHVTVAADAGQANIESAALADPKTQAAIKGLTVRKVIVVKGRMVNVVVG